MDNVTAGFKWAPETEPKEYTMTVKIAPIEMAAPMLAVCTLQPTVNTKKKVPTSSARYFTCDE
jgi:hypothetical protein